MFFIIQSNSTDRLANHLVDFYKTNNKQSDLARVVFEPFTVIVPSMVLGDWLSQTVATKAGISTLFTTQFWGKYQWEMMRAVLQLDGRAYPDEAMVVPEVAMLSASIMRWRIFGFISESFRHNNPQELLSNENHPLHFLVSALYDGEEKREGFGGLSEQRLWQVCDELSKIYVRYLTHRPKWLLAWTKDTPLSPSVEEMMTQKAMLEQKMGGLTHDEEMDWLKEYYVQLEGALRFLWHELFKETYQYRLDLEERFWQVLQGRRDKGGDLSKRALGVLPKSLYLFTIQQIPKVELDFLKELSQYLDVVLLHFNQSMMFWADIVDSQWLSKINIIHPQIAYLRDYGHGLLSRLGKESRDTFAMLAEMSGGADDGYYQVQWQDDFEVLDNQTTLLNGLKSDILMLNKEGGIGKRVGEQLVGALLDSKALTQKHRPKIPLVMDNMGSISIHACHSLTRQLEIARLMIAKYLNDNPSRTLADVVVLLPDVASSEDVIRSVFPKGVGVDGLHLPIKITGVPDKSIEELIFAISGFYTLLGEPTSRFYADEVYEWLLTPALYESFGLTFDEMRRGVALLVQAGFRRGFDEMHLSETLHEEDSDYRYTFSYALDRLVLGLLAPSDTASRALYPFVWREGVFKEATLPLMGITLADTSVIEALTAIHQGLSQNRFMFAKIDSVENLLSYIENDVINRYFIRMHESVAMRAIFNAKNSMMASLRANKYYHYHVGGNQKSKTAYVSHADVRLSMKFVLESLMEMVRSQTISAEPSDVITFARFGAVRSIPFGLTIMLDMNLSSFPRQDRAVRMDLMRAGVRQLGDRYHEDDDKGAFLDALLCTREQCLIFYQGMSADGENKLLPASVVSELIEFLKTEAYWDDKNLADWQNNNNQEEATSLVKEIMPQLIEDYLVTYHAPTFFDETLYYQDDEIHHQFDDLKEQLLSYFRHKIALLKNEQKKSLPPPPIWQRVRRVLDDNKNTTSKSLPDNFMSEKDIHELSNLLSQSLKCQTEEGLTNHINYICDKYQITLPKTMHINELMSGLKNFAKTYLKDKVKISKDINSDEINEPLYLNKLSEYQINDLFIKMAEFDLMSLSDDNSLNELLNKEMVAKDNKIKHVINQIKTLYYGDLLPAGYPRLSTPDELFFGLHDKLKSFVQEIEYLKNDDKLKYYLDKCDGYFSQTKERHIILSDKIAIIDNIPDEDIWLNILPSRAKADNLFKFFVRHLLWQISGKSDKFSLWRFHKSNNDDTFKDVHLFALYGINPLTAKAYIFNLMILLNIAKNTPIIMTHRDGFDYVAQKNNEGFQLSPKIFSGWIDSRYQSVIYEDNSQHKIWQKILQGSNPYHALVRYLPIAGVMYEPMKDYLVAIKVDNQ